MPRSGARLWCCRQPSLSPQPRAEGAGPGAPGAWSHRGRDHRDGPSHTTEGLGGVTGRVTPIKQDSPSSFLSSTASSAGISRRASSCRRGIDPCGEGPGTRCPSFPRPMTSLQRPWAHTQGPGALRGTPRAPRPLFRGTTHVPEGQDPHSPHAPSAVPLHQVHSPATPSSFSHLPYLARSRRTRRRASHTSAQAVRGDAGGADVPRGATSSLPAALPAPGGPDTEEQAQTQRGQLPAPSPRSPHQPQWAALPGCQGSEERVGGQGDRKEWSQGAKSSQGGTREDAVRGY